MKFSTIIASVGLCAALANASKYGTHVTNQPKEHKYGKKNEYTKGHKYGKKNKYKKGHKYGKKNEYTKGHKYGKKNKYKKGSANPPTTAPAPIGTPTPETTNPTENPLSYVNASVNVYDATEDAPLDPKVCAVDDPKYEKCGAPKMSDDGNMPEVSVCGDATYRLPATVALADVCSGSGDTPTGTVCPTQGAETTLACRPNILSYYTGVKLGKNGTCVAPQTATCQKLLTGAWGCVFPGNCNTRNTCLGEEACSDEYEKDEDGKCVLGPNKYPVPNAEYTGIVDTTDAVALPIAVTEYSAHAGAAAMAVSGIIGLATAGTFVFSMM